MSDRASNVDRVSELTGAICDQSASQNDFAELDSTMRADPSSRYQYLDYCRLHVALRLELRAHRATQKLHQQIDIESVVPALSESNAAQRETSSAVPLGILATTFHGTVGYLSSDWSVAYLIATVILGIGLVIGSLVPVSQPAQIARQSPVPSRGDAEPKMEPVGRITGMVDCKWEEGAGDGGPGTGAENQKSEIRNQKSLVTLGDKFALASGLMEITYDTGAKVILQGPVAYEVEAPTGGFLSVGKLTARMEKKVDHWPLATIHCKDSHCHRDRPRHRVRRHGKSRRWHRGVRVRGRDQDGAGRVVGAGARKNRSCAPAVPLDSTARAVASP